MKELLISIFLGSQLGLLCEENFFANVVLINFDFHVRRDDLRNKTSSRSRSVTPSSNNDKMSKDKTSNNDKTSKDKTSKDKTSKDKKSPKRSKKESSSSSNKVSNCFYLNYFCRFCNNPQNN